MKTTQITVVDHELEEFKCLCFMNRLMENHLKVTVRVNLLELTMKIALLYIYFNINVHCIVILYTVGLYSH